MNAKHCGASVSEVLAHAYVSGDAPSAALLAPLISVSLSVAWRNDNSSGSRTRSLLFQCDLSPTWGYIRQRCSLCRCRLLCESIPKLAALQPPWPREQFGILRNYLKRYIETRNDMRYVRKSTDFRSLCGRAMPPCGSRGPLPSLPGWAGSFSLAFCGTVL